mmetsp:Transcript_17133/g.26530  ORF Transcript_17133/g.26530 Transcript_17133/m.26530 type:complete len:531 (-) Transcript_17133:495-2087(-)
MSQDSFLPAMTEAATVTTSPPVTMSSSSSTPMSNTKTTTPQVLSLNTNKRVGRKYRKRPEGKPKRPLSAYNLFFAKERQNIVRKQMEESGSSPEEIDKMLKLGGRSQPHRKTHGKIGFLDLAKTIAEKWKNISDEERDPYLRDAKVEKEKYMVIVEEWKLKNPTLVTGTSSVGGNSSSSSSSTSLTPRKRKAASLNTEAASRPNSTTDYSSSSSSAASFSRSLSTSPDLPESNQTVIASQEIKNQESTKQVLPQPGQFITPLPCTGRASNSKSSSSDFIVKSSLPSESIQLYQQRLSNVINHRDDYEMWKKQQISAASVPAGRSSSPPVQQQIGDLLSPAFGQCKSMIQKLTNTVLAVPQQLGAKNDHSPSLSSDVAVEDASSTSDNKPNNTLIHPLFLNSTTSTTTVTNVWRPSGTVFAPTTTTTPDDHLAALVAHRASLLQQQQQHHPQGAAPPNTTSSIKVPQTVQQQQVRQQATLSGGNGVSNTNSALKHPPVSSLNANNYMSQIGDLATSLDDDCFDILSGFVAR